MSYLRRMALGLVGAAVVGIATIIACEAVTAAVKGSGITPPWADAMPIRIAIVAVPFAVLALLGIVAWRTWLAAIGLTAAFWSFYLFRTLRPDVPPGADIGLGILMLASPLPIAIGALVVHRIARTRR